MDVGLFEAYHEGDGGGPCPSCGANWALLPQRDGVVLILMDHDLHCAYLAWAMAEHRAWMES